MGLLALLVQAVVMTACSMQIAGQAPPAPTAAEISDAAAPLRCFSASQCDRWWRASQVWVVNASALKLQIATDAVLQTYSPSSQTPRWAFTITRAPHLDGGEVFDIRVDCARGYSCAPAYETVVADYKRMVLGVR